MSDDGAALCNGLRLEELIVIEMLMVLSVCAVSESTAESMAVLPRTLDWAERTATLSADLQSEPLGADGDLALDFGAADLRLALLPDDAAPQTPPTSAPEHDAESAGGGGGGGGGGAANDVQALAKASQNPVADMISVPFQNNFNFGIGPNDATQWILNIQPVIPINLGEWNLITRTILPIINQPSPAPGISSEFGLGDLQFTGFFSPAKPGKIIWGVGPVFLFPTASDDALGTGKWSVGPSVVVLTMHKQWVYGVLAQQLWSVAGDSDREDVSSFLLQPFVNYNMKDGWYLTSAPIMTANWEADSDNTWTVPLGGGVGKIMHIGKQPVNISLQAYYNVVTPDDFGADWQLRFQIQLLFPK